MQVHPEKKYIIYQWNVKHMILMSETSDIIFNKIYATKVIPIQNDQHCNSYHEIEVP